MQEITTNELYNKLAEKDTIIIDVRPVNAYNGWQLQNESRGGHIKGAKSLPVKWADYIDWIEIVRSKGLVPGHKIILYGYQKENTEKVARLLHKAGFNDISLYHHFIDEWSANPDLPMERLARYTQLVPPEWLNALITGKKPLHYNNDHFVVCHSHYRNRSDYEKGHIPGAIPVDTNELESTETWNRRSPQELEEALTQHGITKATTVIVYGRFSSPRNEDSYPGSSAGHLGAIRCALILLYAGVKDVRVLNGGITSWEDAGYEISTEENPPATVRNFGGSIPGRPELIVDMPKAKELLHSDDGNLVSVRSWREIIGEVSGYNYIEEKGRIPGAIFGNCGSDAYHMENYRNLDHTTREYHEIAEMWKETGITPDKHNAFYCGTGWRGSEAFFNAWLMGWPRVSVFDGGWFEWSNDPNNPIETG